MVQMNINVKTYKKTVSVNVDSTSKIEDVKNKIKEALDEKNPISTDCLAYRGKHLDDNSCIQDHGISDNEYLLYLYSTEGAVEEINEVVNENDLSSFLGVNSSEVFEKLLTMPQVVVPLTMLMEMGFSEQRSLRALLLNQFEQTRSLDWLLANIDNPAYDEPLGESDFGYLQQYIAVDPLKNAIDNNICTYSVTGDEFVRQKWYFCYTCGLVDSEGCCEVCAKICHKGHHLSEPNPESQFFCDCGASGACQCLRIDGDEVEMNEEDMEEEQDQDQDQEQGQEQEQEQEQLE